MAKSEWKVQCNYVGGERLYIPYRVLNTAEVVHSGNIEHFGEYTKDKAEAEKIVAELNRNGD